MQAFFRVLRSGALRGWLAWLAIIIAFHFWGPIGSLLALLGYLGFYILLARIEADRSERQRIAEMVERGNLR
jgi:hypothetical protein